MTCKYSVIVPWLGTVLCCCHVLSAGETAQYASSDLLESLHNETDPVHNASSTSKAALLSIFTKYGQNGSLSFEGFEQLLESLHLGNIAMPDGNITEHHGMKGSWSVTLAADDYHSQTDHHHHHHDDELHMSDDAGDNNQVEQHDTHSSSSVCTDSLSSVVN